MSINSNTNTNTNFYQFDGCYSKPINPNFDGSLNVDFNNTVVQSVAECQAEALKSNSSFFIMNDISTSNITNNSSNCYVPKQLSLNLGSIVSENTMLQLFSKFFGSSTKTGVNDTCNNMLFRRTPINNPANQKCFTYTLDEQVYAPKNQYAYYKKPILTESNLTLMSSLRSRPTSYYNNETKLTQLRSYRDLLYINETNIAASGPLYTTFKNFICNPTKENERLFDIQLETLKSKYSNLVNHLNDISVDLSNINSLKKDDNNTIIALNARITSKKQELANLLGSGGANNGRLDDNVFLTQFKIVENGILLLIIITVCFIYYKTRNIKSLLSASGISTITSTNGTTTNGTTTNSTTTNSTTTKSTTNNK